MSNNLQKSYVVTITRHYIKEQKVIVVGEYSPEEGMEIGMNLIDNNKHSEGTLVYLGELDEFSIKNVE